MQTAPNFFFFSCENLQIYPVLFTFNNEFVSKMCKTEMLIF